MANERHIASETGLTIYSLGWRPTDNKVWNPSTDAFEAFSLASWATYADPVSEVASGAGLYEGDWTPGTTAGRFIIVFYKQLGSAAASTDERLGTATLVWSGSAETDSLTDAETATASASSTLLANLALTWIGARTITSLNDTSAEARACNRIYNRTRDGVIAMHRWNSCTKHVALAELSESEVFAGWDHTYQLPTDFIRFSRPELLDYPYKIIAGNKVLSNRATFSCEYIARIENVAEMDELLKHAIAAKMAADLAVPLKGDRALAGDMQKRFMDTLAEARFVDSNQHSTLETAGSAGWLSGRINQTAAGWGDSV